MAEDREGRGVSREGSAVYRQWERKRQKIVENAEAGEAQLQKLIEKALKDEKTYQNINRDCLERYQGRKQSSQLPDGTVDPRTGRLLRGKQEAPIADGERDPSITGLEHRYWEDGDSQDDEDGDYY